MGFNNKKNGLSNIESLLKKKNLSYNDHWNPSGVDYYKKNLFKGELEDLADPVRSQIAYSLQYLDFLNVLIDDLKLNCIVEAELYKTYLITAVSIIEAILNHVVIKKVKNGAKIKSEQLKKIARIEETKTVIENNGTIDGDTKFFRVSVVKPVDPPEYTNEPKLRDLIDISKDLHCGLCNSAGYDMLHDLREMRNSIHLTIDKMSQSDYNRFNKKWYYTVRVSLHFLLMCNKFDIVDPEVYDFIKLTEAEEKEFDELKK